MAEAIRRTRRSTLSRKYVKALAAVVGSALAASAGLDLYFSYRDTRSAVGELQGEKAAGAAATIEQFVIRIQRELRGAAGTITPSDTEALLTAFRRILFQLPAVTGASYADPRGIERVRVSRLAADEIGTNRNVAGSAAFLGTRSADRYIGPLRFEHSEPYLTIAERARGGGVVAADVNLSSLSDVVEGIDAGDRGTAYVIDVDGRLIAHPDRTLVLGGRTRLTAAHVRRAAASASGRGNGLSGEGVGGGRVIASFRRADPPGWPVIVEQPVGAVSAPIRRRVLLNAAVLLTGLLMAVGTSAWLARRMVRPIRTLQRGAAGIGAGDLDQRIAISTGDELESLADEFNRMTERLAKTLDDLRMSRVRLVAAHDEERRRMERDLHDGAQQQILATIIQLRLLSDRVPTELKDSVQKVSEQATAALETVREVARGMYSPKLAAAGLPMALRAQGAGAPYELEISADEPFPRFEQHVETAVYYCCLEALQNAAKHAAAKRVNLSIHADESRLTFSIADNGRGFEPATSRQGVGTQSMRDRIAALGGELTITSAPGEGTSVEGWVPAHPAMPVEAGSRPDVVSEQTLR